MCLILALEREKILPAENDYIIGMQHKITTYVHAKTRLLKEVRYVISEFSH